MFGIRSRARAATLDLAIGPTVAGAIDRLARRWRRLDLRRESLLDRRALAYERKASELRRREREFRPVAAAMPTLRGRHPIPHRLALPRRYSRRLPPTVLERQRRLGAARRGRPPYADAVEGGAQRVASAIRARLLALRGHLLALQRKLAALTGSRRRMGGY